LASCFPCPELTFSSSFGSLSCLPCLGTNQRGMYVAGCGGNSSGFLSFCTN
jgi:hypothetical protein